MTRWNVMLALLIRRLSVPVLLIPLSAFADPVTSGWSMGLSCPPKGADGAGAMAASNAAGFAGGGTCRRVPGLFSKLTFTTHGGGALRSTSTLSLQTPSVLITPPLLTTESQPIFSVANACPVAPGTLDLNWLFVQWTDAERRALTNTYLFGTATYSAAQGVRITGQYDIDGNPYSLASHSMHGSCTNGVYPVTGSVYSDINGSIYFNAAGMGVFKTQAGRATFFFPRFTVTAAAHFGSKTFRGIAFDADGANGAGAIRHIKGTADVAGTTFTVQALADPENDIVDSGGTAYTDTISFGGGNINNPAPGMLFGTVIRTGNGAGSSSIACVANAADGETLLLCSGQSPSDNLLPFHFSLYAERQHNQAGGPNDEVNVMALDESSGKIYVGGRFTTFNDSRRNAIARLNADGTLDSNFDPGSGFDGSVYALAFDGASGKLFVGGEFTTFNGTARNSIARLNADGTLDTSFDPGSGFDAEVWALALDATSGKLYAGGPYSTFDGIGRNGIVRLNADGSHDSTFDPGSGFDGSVSSLAFDESSGKLYAGGWFPTFNGIARRGIARLNSDGTLDTGFDPGSGATAPVEALAFDALSGKLYLGGAFITFNGTGRERIARLNADGSLDTAFGQGSGFSNAVQSLALDPSSGKLYAGGVFTSFDGTGRNRIARLHADGTLDSSFDPGSAFDRRVYALQVDGASEKLYVGGQFSTFNGAPRKSFARINSDGTVDSGFDYGSGFDAAVHAIALDPSSGKQYAVGAFTTFNGTDINGIARLNADGTFDTDFDAGSGFDGPVHCVAFEESSEKIYTGGAFTTFDGAARGGIARLNGDGSLDTGFDPGSGANGNVDALALDVASGKLYVGGAFTTFDGIGRSGIVRLNSDGTVDSTFDPGSGFDGDVNALVLDVSSGKLYAGGSFTTFNGTGRNSVARLNPDGTLDTGFDPGAAFDDVVYALALHASSGTIYAGGGFTSFAGTGVNRIARLRDDGSLDTGFDPGSGFDGWVYALAVDASSGKAYVAGEFTVFSGTTRNSLARLNPDGTLDSTFDPGSGFYGWVAALVFHASSGKLSAGGNATAYGSSSIGHLVRLTYSGALD